MQQEFIKWSYVGTIIIKVRKLNIIIILWNDLFQDIQLKEFKRDLSENVMEQMQKRFHL